MVETAMNRVNALANVSRIHNATVRDASLTTLPDASKFIFRGRALSLAVVNDAFGVDLPQTANRFNAVDARKAYWLGPDEWLLEAVGEEPESLFAALSQKLTSCACSLVDVSHRSDSLAISGSASGYILNHGCPLDLSEEQFPIGMCSRTVLGKSPILLSRSERDVFHLDVWRSFAPYVWCLLDEARQELI